MPEESHLLERELTFPEFGIKPMVAKPLQNCSKMLLVFILSLAVDEDVINEYHHKNLSKKSINTLFIICIKNAGALVRPKDITVYS